MSARVSLAPLAAAAFAAMLLALAPPGRAQAEKRGPLASFPRGDETVVLTGAELPRLAHVPKEKIRVFAVRDFRFVAIPFQVDERTPELDYCWTRGPEPLPKDVDDGLLDEDDELVLRAGDAGERAPDDLALPAGATARHEIELDDPVTGARGFAYALAFEKDPPPRSPERYVAATIDSSGGAHFATRSFEVAATGSAGATGRPTHVRFIRDGRPGPEVVTHGARARLHASYLFARIDRDEREARTSIGPALIDGPVRLVVPVALEVYLIWGNWVQATRSSVFIHGHTWEHRARVFFPVDLPQDEASHLRLAIELASPRGWRVASERHPGLVPLGPPDATFDRRFPSWLLLLGEPGGVLASVELDARIANAKGELHWSETPDPGHVGFSVDLTGLTKTEAEPYALGYRLDLVPGLTEAAAPAWIAARERPLKRLVR